METAVALIAACQFLMGATFKITRCKILDMEPGDRLKSSAVRKNATRIEKAEKASSGSGKKCRKLLKYSKLKKEQKTKVEEGTSYLSDGSDY